MQGRLLQHHGRAQNVGKDPGSCIPPPHLLLVRTTPGSVPNRSVLVLAEAQSRCSTLQTGG